MKVDTLGFIAPPFAPLEADPRLADNIDLMHVTVAPPTMKSGVDILNGTDRFPGLSTARQMLENQPNLMVVESTNDLHELEGSGKTGIILGLQETPYDVTAGMLREFYEQGVRIITPAYSAADHPVGAGFTSPVNPLTAKGREFLLDCEDLGLMVDLSHLGHQTARDVLEFRENQGINLPILASHGGVHELYKGDKSDINNLRNLPWDVLEQVGSIGGIVGIYALTFGLSEKDDSTTPFVSQIREAVKRLGPDAVSLGTDAVYQQRDRKEWENTTRMMIGMLAKAGELKPRFPDTPLALNEVGKIALIEKALASTTDLSENEITGVAGNNAKKFFTDSLK